MRRVLVLAALSTVLGCQRVSDDDTGSLAVQPSSSPILAQRLADSLARTFTAGHVVPACVGIQQALSVPIAPPMSVVATTGKACLGCRDVGYLMRQLRAQHTPPNVPLALWVPANDTVEVCGYAKAEKLSVFVLASAEPFFPVDQLSENVLYFALTDSAAVSTPFIAPHGLTLARLLEARADTLR